jgi:hypothetical protein
MARLRIDLGSPVFDGQTLVFRSPVDCSEITGLSVHYFEEGVETSKVFAFKDAHGNDLANLDNLFADGVLIQVLLDVTNSAAFITNADTSGYIEGTFVKTINGEQPNEDGDVQVVGNEGKSAYEFAKDGGYTGTEEEFAGKLAAEYRPANWMPSASEVGAAASEHNHSADEVTSGVLPYARGGTGKALGDVPNYAIMRNAGDGDYMWYLATGNGALYATAANGSPTFGTLPVAQGGTGKTTHTANAVLTGNGTGALKNVAAANGAFFSTGSGVAPKFGTLPVKQGGTGATSEVAARKALGTNMKLLWTNASPTSTFESFTPLTNSDLAESLANFTAILVWFNVTPEATQHSFSIIPIGLGSGTDIDDVKNTTLCFATGDNKWVRRYGWATTSAITFGTGGYKTSLSANWTVNSKYMVPDRIYGIR